MRGIAKQYEAIAKITASLDKITVPPMATKRLKRPRDPVALAKLIGDIATGQVEDRVEDKRDPAAVALGQRGGKGRAAGMTAKKRKEIAKAAAAKRWGK